MSLIVIGTDTDVGKTVICAVLLTRYAGNGIAYWKPIATGPSEGRDTCVIESLCSGVEILPERYLFPLPASPHLAAREAHASIDPAEVIRSFRTYRQSHPQHPLLVEGIGGLLVPLTDEGYLLADLIAEMELTCLLVSSTRVGTINHTLLTLEALRTRDLPFAGIVLNGPPTHENQHAIESFGHVGIVGTVEPIDPLSVENVGESSRKLDPEGLLEPYFAGQTGSLPDLIHNG